MAHTYLSIVFSVHPEVLISRAQGKGMEEKKKSHQIFGRGSQVDSVGVYKANTAATLTLGPLNIALFELKKKPWVFARRLILVQISKVIPSIRALHGGEERRSEQTSPQANFTLHASVWAGGSLLWSLTSWEWKPGGRWSCSGMADSLQRWLDRTS